MDRLARRRKGRRSHRERCPYTLLRARAIGAQFDISLDRLGLGQAPIYIMHRENPEIRVGGFVDAISRLHEAGRIRIWGGSNRSTQRLAQACDSVTTHGGLTAAILNSNLSLAVMERPVWPGCISSNDPAFLRDRNVVRLSWSSQARGYVLPEALRDPLLVDTRPETCFDSGANAERRRRAERPAAERGVSAHNVALAWVLSQPFLSLALIGPALPGRSAPPSRRRRSASRSARSPG
jgi:aryl-alcohol dehydrogenase-like predicted oxidoreductase